MGRDFENEQKIQRAYYARTARDYDAAHLEGIDEHQFALVWLKSIIELLEITSILDIGSGTGRALLSLKRWFPQLRVVGVEPSPHLREIGYAKGLRADELVSGDARDLSFGAGEFDVVCEFATLHHIPKPNEVVNEMLRVARLGIFISDSNNFGQGSFVGRSTKQLLRALRLWKAFDLLRTRGKGYMTSEGDGLFYSYSVFDNYDQVSEACDSVHVLNTRSSGRNLYRSAPTVALLGLK